MILPHAASPLKGNYNPGTYQAKCRNRETMMSSYKELKVRLKF